MQLYSDSGHDGFAVRGFPQVPAVSGPSVDAVLVDGDILWYGCGRKLCRRELDVTRVFGPESGLADSAIMVIRKDGDGNLWVRARNAGVFELPASQSNFRRPDVPTPSTVVGVPGIDSAGRILLPSPAGLLIRDGKHWQTIDRSLGLRGAVYSVFEDRRHSLWIGLAGRGLVQWRGNRTTTRLPRSSWLPFVPGLPVQRAPAVGGVPGSVGRLGRQRSRNPPVRNLSLRKWKSYLACLSRSELSANASARYRESTAASFS